MAYDGSRQMYDVDLTCAKCGSHISQLPFQPSGDRPVYCSDCNRAFRQNREGGHGGGASRGPRQSYAVDVDCAQCGKKITELPFQPTGDRPVYCRECMVARKNG